MIIVNMIVYYPNSVPMRLYRSLETVELSAIKIVLFYAHASMDAFELCISSFLILTATTCTMKITAQSNFSVGSPSDDPQNDFETRTR